MESNSRGVSGLHRLSQKSPRLVIPNAVSRGLRALRFLLSALCCLLICTELASAMTVTVWPEKLCVKPNQLEKVTVTVADLPAGQTKAEVRCRVTTGLDKVVLNCKGATDAHGIYAFTLKPKAQWGYAVEAVASAGGVTAQGMDVFACARNPHMVAPGYTSAEVYGPDLLPDNSPAPPGKPMSPYRQADIKQQVARARFLYTPVVELVGPAFDSFSSIKPPVENYFKGGSYVYSVNAIRGLIDDLHANGIKSVIYVNGCLTGIAGTEFARKHPEYLAYSPDGTPFAEVNTRSIPVHQWYIQNYPESCKLAQTWRSQTPAPEAVRYGGDYRSLMGDYPGFLNAMQNFEDPKLAEMGAKFILEGKAYFGYDGVRFDADYSVPAIGDPLAPCLQFMDYRGEPQRLGKEAEHLTARNLAHAYTLMRKGNPDFLLGINNADFRNDQMGDHVFTTEKIKAIAPGNWVLDEVAKGALEAAAPDHKWADFIRNMSMQADRIRKVGDFLSAGWGGGPGQKAVDTRQIVALSYACGLRWIPGGYKPEDNDEVRHLYSQFAMRYGEFILNNNLKRLPATEVEKQIQVTASRPLFWESFVQRLSTPTARCLVLHLINQPMEDVLTDDAKEPLAATDVRITLHSSLFEGRTPSWSAAKVLCPDQTPQAAPAVVTSSGNSATLTIPKITNWTMVVAPY